MVAANNAEGEARSEWWALQSRNEKLLTMNLGHEEDLDLARRLLAESDILVGNFKPGTLEKLGWDVLHELNPRLILIRVSGYGQDGPYKDRPGFANVTPVFAGLEQIGQRSPLLGHVRPGRCHRDLRETAGDERGEDNADLPTSLVEGLAGEHEAWAGGQPLRPGSKTRVGRLEPEVVPAHQAKDTFPQAAGQGEQVFPRAAGGEASAGIPHRLRGEGRRHEEASRLEVEARVHGSGSLWVLTRKDRPNSSNHDDGPSRRRRKQA
jgi:hypothetical protein